MLFTTFHIGKWSKTATPTCAFAFTWHSEPKSHFWKVTKSGQFSSKCGKSVTFCSFWAKRAQPSDKSAFPRTTLLKITVFVQFSGQNVAGFLWPHPPSPPDPAILAVRMTVRMAGSGDPRPGWLVLRVAQVNSGHHGWRMHTSLSAQQGYNRGVVRIASLAWALQPSKLACKARGSEEAVTFLTKKVEKGIFYGKNAAKGLLRPCFWDFNRKWPNWLPDGYSDIGTRDPSAWQTRPESLSNIDDVTQAKAWLFTVGRPAKLSLRFILAHPARPAQLAAIRRVGDVFLAKRCKPGQNV